MEAILLNLKSKARRVTRNGREYLVAPMTLIVPGVLPGSRGPLYYPPDEVATNYTYWNDFPIVVYHPKKNGRHVSGRAVEVLDKSKIGRVYNSSVTPDGKLRVEGWFDVETTRRVDSRVLEALEKGEPLELSTGLFTDNEPSEGTDPRTGRRYTAIARNYRPDHVAILPDQVGACSIKDGCGVLVNLAHQISVAPSVDEPMEGHYRPGVSVNSLPGDGGTGYFGHCDRDPQGRCLPGGPGAAHETARANRSSLKAYQATEKAHQANTAEAHLAAMRAHAKAAEHHFVAGDELGILATKAAIRSDEASKNFFTTRLALAHAHQDRHKDHLAAVEQHREARRALKKTTANVSNCGPSCDCDSCLTSFQDHERERMMGRGNFWHKLGEFFGILAEEDGDPLGVAGLQVVPNRLSPTDRSEELTNSSNDLPALEELTDEDRRLGSQTELDIAAAGHNPPSWVDDEAAWARAKELANKGSYDKSSYWAVVAHIYQKITGSSGYKGKRQSKRKYGKKKVQPQIAKNSGAQRPAGGSSSEWEIANTEDGKDVPYEELMADVASAFRESHPVQYDPEDGNMLEPCHLISVFDGYVIYQEGDKLYREGYSPDDSGDLQMDGDEEEVERVVKYLPVGNEVGPDGPDQENKDMAIKLTPEGRKEIVGRLLASKFSPNAPWKGLDQPALEALTDNELATYNECHKSLSAANLLGQAPPQPTGNATPPPAPPPVPVAIPVPPPPPPQRPKSLSEALEAFGTPEEKAVWNSAVAVYNETRQRLVQQLIVNVIPELKSQAEAFYGSMTVDQLNFLVSAMPRQEPAQAAPSQPVSLFTGLQGPPPSQPTINEEPLLSPTYDFNEKVA